MGLVKKKKKGLKTRGMVGGSSTRGSQEESDLRPYFVEKKPPCGTNCPNHNPIRKALMLLSKAEDYEKTNEQALTEAWQLWMTKSPFPSVCGRVCPQEAVLDEKGRICERMRFRSRWEKPVFDNEKCISCTVCIEACPTACLSLWFTRDHENTRGYPILKKERDCIACGICVSECPVDAVKMVAPSSA